MPGQSAVDFATAARIHIALEAADVDRSTAFYRTLFGQGPTKVKPGYAKFEVAEPPVNLTLNAVPASHARGAGVSHFGVQVKSTDTVQAMTKRFEEAGLPTRIEDDVTCCYAVQDKVWVDDPDGNAWEVFVVLDNTPAEHGKQSVGCCTGEETCAPLVSLS